MLSTVPPISLARGIHEVGELHTGFNMCGVSEKKRAA